MPTIQTITSHTIDLTLNRAFETSKGRKTTSPSVIIQIALENGITGLGSSTPVEYVTGENTESVLSKIQKASPLLTGTDITDHSKAYETLAEALPSSPSARAGLEIAVLDAHCKLKKTPMSKLFGNKKQHIETDITIPIVSPSEAYEIARKAQSQGFKYLKLKVGKFEDFDRVEAAGKGAPGCRIRLDANQGFTPEGAIDFVNRLFIKKIDIDILEQPVDRSDIEGLRHVTKNLPIPVFADESAITSEDARRLIETDSVDGINIKLMKSGISDTMKIIEICRSTGKELMIGCMLETRISLSAAIHLACGTGAFDRIDLDAHTFTADDPYAGGFASNSHELNTIAARPGHGCFHPQNP